MSFVEQLQRRGVIRAALIYAVGAFGAIEIITWVLGNLDIDAPAWVMPGMTILFLAGFPVAMYLAWVSDIERRPAVTWVAAALILTGTTLVLFFTVDPRLDTTPRVAVLPPLHSSGGQEEIALWATNDLRDLLSEIDEIEVIGQTTSMRVVDDQDTMIQQLREFGATHLVRTELSRNPGRLRYLVSLEQLAGKVLGSETYHGEPLDLFGFQKEAVENIAAMLGIPNDAAGLRIVRLRRDPAQDLAAFEAVARGDALRERFDLNCDQAMVHYERARGLDPALGRAYFGIGMCQSLRAWIQGLPHGDALWEAGVQNLRRAAELDASIAVEAYEWIANYEAARNNWQAARRALDRARLIDPAAFAFVLSNSTGHCAEVVDVMLGRYELDPLEWLIPSMLGFGYLACPDIADRERGLYWYEVAWRMQGGGNFVWAVPALLDVGDIDTARQYWDHGAEFSLRDFARAGVDLDALRELEFAALTDPAQVEPFVSRLEQLQASGLVNPVVNSSRYVEWFIRVGDVARTYDAINQAIADEHFNVHAFMWYGPGPSAVRDDPRYMQVLERIGLVDYWREHGLPPMCEQREGGEIRCT